MIQGLTIAEIHDLTERFKAAVVRSVRCRQKAEQYTAAAAEAEKEASELQIRLEKLARGSQHDVTFNHLEATAPSHRSHGTDTPPLPARSQANDNG